MIENMDLVVRPDSEIADLVPGFLENRRIEFKELKSAAARSDFDFMRRLAHTWKGVCRPYGFIFLEMLSLRLESQALDSNLNEIHQTVETIGDYLENVSVHYN
jgi:HPt (histidine-containing phosphotransfer) domain-containing protein